MLCNFLELDISFSFRVMLAQIKLEEITVT